MIHTLSGEGAASSGQELHALSLRAHREEQVSGYLDMQKDELIQLCRELELDTLATVDTLRERIERWLNCEEPDAQDEPEVQEKPEVQDEAEAQDEPKAQDELLFFLSPASSPDSWFFAPEAQNEPDAQDKPDAQDEPVVQDKPKAHDEPEEDEHQARDEPEAQGEPEQDEPLLDNELVFEMERAASPVYRFPHLRNRNLLAPGPTCPAGHGPMMLCDDLYNINFYICRTDFCTITSDQQDWFEYQSNAQRGGVGATPIWDV